MEFQLLNKAEDINEISPLSEDVYLIKFQKLSLAELKILFEGNFRFCFFFDQPFSLSDNLDQLLLCLSSSNYHTINNVRFLFFDTDNGTFATALVKEIQNKLLFEITPIFSYSSSYIDIDTNQSLFKKIKEFNNSTIFLISNSFEERIEEISNLETDKSDLIQILIKRTLDLSTKSFLLQHECNILKNDLFHQTDSLSIIRSEHNKDIEWHINQSKYFENEFIKTRDWAKEEITKINQWHESQYNFLPVWFLKLAKKVYKLCSEIK